MNSRVFCAAAKFRSGLALNALVSMRNNVGLLHSGVWDDLCCCGGLLIDGLFSILMECLNVVARLRIMILVVLVCSVDTILFSFIFIFLWGFCVVLFLFIVIEAGMRNVEALASIVIIIQVFLFLAFILNSARIVAAIITRVVDVSVTRVHATVGTGIVRVATV